jgi:L-asparaginase
MQSLVILGTGGTIAGTAADPADHVGYRAGQIGVAALVAAVPSLAGQPIECEQVAQIDSKDLEFEVWQALAQRAAHHLARADVQAVLITHGTDTLEETAYLLHRVLATRKPVVLTAAMRPASAAEADGPANLRDAARVARDERASGVIAVMAGHVHAGVELRKRHASALDAFEPGDAGPIAEVLADRIEVRRAWPTATGWGPDRLPGAAQAWPRVEIVTSHAGARAETVRALVADGVQGLVVAATGNGTVHQVLEEALLDAQQAGVAVLRASRCSGGITPGGDDRLPSAGPLSPVQARIELMLRLLGRA